RHPRTSLCGLIAVPRPPIEPRLRPGRRLTARPRLSPKNMPVRLVLPVRMHRVLRRRQLLEPLSRLPTLRSSTIPPSVLRARVLVRAAIDVAEIPRLRPADRLIAANTHRITALHDLPERRANLPMRPAIPPIRIRAHGITATGGGTLGE